MKRLTDIAVPIAPEERAILIAMCKAHDREDSAQRGEPDPWTLDSEEALDGSQWQEDRVHAMREALAAFLSSAKEPQIEGWRDIASAPKDGSPFMAFRPQIRPGKGHTLLCVAWSDEDGAWIWPDDVYDAYNRADYAEAIEKGDLYQSVKFTHWMPLPALPSSGGGHE